MIAVEGEGRVGGGRGECGGVGGGGAEVSSLCHQRSVIPLVLSHVLRLNNVEAIKDGSA